MKMLCFLLLMIPGVLMAQGTAPSVLTGGSTGTNGNASFLGYISLTAMPDANYTLRPNEWWPGTIVIPSSVTLTAIRAITPPANAGQKFVLGNYSTGGFAVTVNGISVANGSQVEFDYVNGAYVALGGTGGGCTSGCTFTSSSINGVTPTTSGSSTTYLNGTGAYSTPAGGGSSIGSASINTANSQLVADSVAVTPFNGLWTFGASITQGYGCTSYATCWVNLVYNDIGYTGTVASNITTGDNSSNWGGGGETAADVSGIVFSQAPIVTLTNNPIFVDGGDEYVNNITHLTSDTTGIANQFRTAIFTRLAVANMDEVLVGNSACTATGTFTADTSFTNTQGKTTTTAGNTISCTVVVGKTGVFYTWGKYTTGTAGSYEVLVDGIVATETNSGGTTQSAAGSSFFATAGPAVIGGRYVTTPGWHTLTFQNLSGSTTFYGFVAPPNRRYRGISGPRLIAGTVPPISWPATAYSIASNVITITTGASNLVAGQVVVLGGFPASTFLNGQALTIASAPNPNSFTANFTHANASATEYGQVLANQSQIAAYNTAIVSLIQQFQNVDGLNIALFDQNAILDPYIDYSLGAVQGWSASTNSGHPSDRGHRNIAEAVEAVIGATGPGAYPTFPTATVTGNASIAKNLYFGSSYIPQSNVAFFYDGAGDGNSLTISAVNGDGNVHFSANGAAVLFQGSSPYYAYAPFNLQGGGLIAGGYNAYLASLYLPTIGSSTSPLCTTAGGLITNSGCSTFNAASPPPIGNTTPNTGTFTVVSATTNIVSPSFVAPTTGTATSSANFGSGAYGVNGSYWTGSTSNTDNWSFSNSLGTGTNPTSTLSLFHTGSSGYASVAMPNVNVAGFMAANVVQSTAVITTPGTFPVSLFSASGTALPTCNSSIKGEQVTVSDATSPTYMGAYTSGGAIVAAVICSYNGTTYSWLTH